VRETIKKFYEDQRASISPNKTGNRTDFQEEGMPFIEHYKRKEFP
jgi:hypothetical protein